MSAMIVPDASALAMLFADPDSEPRHIAAAGVLRADPEWVVPEHWRTEVLSIIRGLRLGGRIDLPSAERVVSWLAQFVVVTAPTAPQLRRMWELKDNLGASDAGYVAVAESHGLTLVTADVRISRAGVARCAVQVIA